jgi:hypothetical protein
MWCASSSRDSRLALLPTLPPRHGLVESIRLAVRFACVTQLQTVLTLCLLLLSMSGLVSSTQNSKPAAAIARLGRPLRSASVRRSQQLAVATNRPQGRNASLQVVCCTLYVARCPLHAVRCMADIFHQ